MGLPNRKKRNIVAKKDIYIFTEGKETEVIYLNRIKQLLRASTIKIKVRGVGESSSNLVDYAYRAVSREKNVGSVWVVFDRDALSPNEIQTAYKSAKMKGIDVAFSNINFEIWLLLHFESLICPTPLTNKSLYSKLEKYLNVKNYERDHKSNVKLINSIADNYKTAIKNNLMLLDQSSSMFVTPYTDIVKLIHSINT